MTPPRWRPFIFTTSNHFLNDRSATHLPFQQTVKSEMNISYNHPPHPIPLPATVNIRAMHKEDLAEVEEIDRISFNTPWPASAYDYELHENPNSLLWVAEVESSKAERRVVGMIVTWLILDEAHIANIAVHPAYRNQGIARKLLARALQDAIERGARLVTLEVRQHNLLAQALYRRFGFEITGRRLRYYRDNNEDAFIMTISDLDFTGGQRPPEHSGQTYLDWLKSGKWEPARDKEHPTETENT